MKTTAGAVDNKHCTRYVSLCDHLKQVLNIFIRSALGIKIYTFSTCSILKLKVIQCLIRSAILLKEIILLWYLFTFQDRTTNLF